MNFNLRYSILILIHIIIGIAVYYNETLAKPYFFLILLYFAYKIFGAPNHLKTFEVLSACAYLVGAEVFLRMTRGSISYEAAKYLIMLLAIVGAFYKGFSGRAYPYFLYIMLLVPSIFVASTTLSFDANFRTNITFVLSGPVCLGVISMFCFDKKVTQNQVMDILLYMLLPIVTHTAYIYFYNPSVRDVITNTASNRAASGGFGANQVATVLGLGVFLAAVRFFMKSKSMSLKVLNVLLLMLILYRAIVTFSRGGVIVAFLCIAAFLVIYYRKVGRVVKQQILFASIIMSFGLAATWVVSSSETKGLIDLRYENKDAQGRQKGDISTGRKELFLKELDGFLKNPFVGIGSSRAKDQRIEVEGQGVTSHNEISRLLAEHGMLGVMILVILVFRPIAYRSRNRKNIFFYAFLGFWFATINHSSMRIAAPAFIYALSLLNVTNENNSVHRKQIKAAA